MWEVSAGFQTDNMLLFATWLGSLGREDRHLDDTYWHFNTNNNLYKKCFTGKFQPEFLDLLILEVYFYKKFYKNLNSHQRPDISHSLLNISDYYLFLPAPVLVTSRELDIITASFPSTTKYTAHVVTWYEARHVIGCRLLVLCFYWSGRICLEVARALASSSYN